MSGEDIRVDYSHSPWDIMQLEVSQEDRTNRLKIAIPSQGIYELEVGHLGVFQPHESHGCSEDDLTSSREPPK